MAEKFSVSEITLLRNDLLSITDSFLAMELFHHFLTKNGYGISRELAFEVAGRLHGKTCSMENLCKELEGLALAS